MKRGTIRRLDALATEGVERAEANGPPTAFRIWKAGVNPTDHGPTVFSERSATLLMAQQAVRGNRFSMDVDHLSLNVEAPLESRRAVGWFSLEVRDGELWATDVEWTDTVRAGLTKDPPEWKYFSPAYDIDPETNEVVSFLNCALTNNPATHAVTALASNSAGATKGIRMKYEDLIASLCKMAEGDDDNAGKARAALKAMMPDDDEEKKDAADGEDDAKKDAEDKPDKKDAADEDGDEEKKDTAIAAALAEVNRLAARVRDLEVKGEADERKTLLASRPDFAPELVAILAKAPLSVVRDSVAKLPKTSTLPATTETVQATRGEGQGDARASRLPAEEKAALDARMGIARREASIKHEGVHSYFPVLTAEDARRIVAAKNGGK
jgi:hypothetical protein